MLGWNKFFAVLVTLVIAPAAVVADTQNGKWSKFEGTYMLYGGSLDEMAPPSAGDTKLSMFIEGQLAKELFTRLGPGAREHIACADDIETRTRGPLTCTKASEGGPVECTIGFDIRKGKAIAGSIC